MRITAAPTPIPTTPRTASAAPVTVAVVTRTGDSAAERAERRADGRVARGPPEVEQRVLADLVRGQVTPASGVGRAGGRRSAVGALAPPSRIRPAYTVTSGPHIPIQWAPPSSPMTKNSRTSVPRSRDVHESNHLGLGSRALMGFVGGTVRVDSGASLLHEDGRVHPACLVRDTDVVVAAGDLEGV